MHACVRWRRARHFGARAKLQPANDITRVPPPSPRFRSGGGSPDASGWLPRQCRAGAVPVSRRTGPLYRFLEPLARTLEFPLLLLLPQQDVVPHDHVPVRAATAAARRASPGRGAARRRRTPAGRSQRTGAGDAAPAASKDLDSGGACRQDSTMLKPRFYRLVPSRRRLRRPEPYAQAPHRRKPRP